MRSRMLVVAVLPTLIILASCTKAPRVGARESTIDRLRTELDAMFDSPEFFNAHWGVVIQSVDQGEYLYTRNPDKGFMPASNMKLFTTAMGLQVLGADYVFHTTVYRNGEILPDGTLDGDLILVGSGDPGLGGRYTDGQITAQLVAWIDTLQSRGIKKINGRIIGDDNLFTDEIMGEGWAWDYQSDWYAAQISALSFNDNCVDIIFSAGDSVGAKARFRLEPATRYVQIDNQVVCVPDGQQAGIGFDRARGRNFVTIRGSLSIAANERRSWFSVENPTAYTAFVFRELLQQKNIAVSGEAVDIDSLANYTYAKSPDAKLIDYASPPLSKICETINKVSQNLYAELVFRAAGLKRYGLGSFENGLKVMEGFLAGIGINPQTMSIVDGSGLSRLDLVSPRQIASVLRAMRRDLRNGEVYYNSLPIAGVDGSLKGRMQNSPATGRVHAKTGYIGKARALSGYVTTADDEELVFSMVVNNYTVPTTMADAVQDVVCQRLATFSRYGRPQLKAN